MPNKKQLLQQAKERYEKGMLVDTGTYQSIVQGEIVWSKDLKTIYCDSCPLYFAQENRWADIIECFEITAIEKTTVKTTGGDIILQKFGKEYIALDNIPNGLNKESKTFINLKKNITNNPEQFIGQKLPTVFRI